MLDCGEDQAAGLRRIVAPARLSLLTLPVSAKGPHHWIVRMARTLCSVGARPILVDASKLAVSRAFGLKPRYDLIDLLKGVRQFDQVAQATSDGIHVLRADAGVEAFVASGAPAAELFGGFARLSQGFDVLLLAMATSELACLAKPGCSVPVVSIDTTNDSRVLAYGTIKHLARAFGYSRFALVISDTEDLVLADDQCRHFARTANTFLNVHVALGGCLRSSKHLSDFELETVGHNLLEVATSPLTVNS